MNVIQVCVVWGIEKVINICKIFVKRSRQMIFEKIRKSDQRRSENDDK